MRCAPDRSGSNRRAHQGLHLGATLVWLLKGCARRSRAAPGAPAVGEGSGRLHVVSILRRGGGDHRQRPGPAGGRHHSTPQHP